MGLKETKEFKNHVELESVSEIREQYVQGELFAEGDRVVIKTSQQEGYVHRLGANYIIVALDEGRISRQWLENVEKIDEASFGDGSVMKDFFPGIVSWLDKNVVNPKKYQYAVRTFLDLRKKNPKNARYNLSRAAQIADVDVRTLDKVFRQMVKSGKMPKHLVNYTPTFNEETIHEEVSQKQLNDLEKFGDRLLAKFDIDIEFTRHFADRMNDTRNNPAISVSELQRLFKKIAKEKGVNIKKHGDSEAVLKDIQSDLNLPVVINYKNGEFEVVNKTIMRKKDFKTTSPVVKYESTIHEDEVSDARAEIEKDRANAENRLKRRADRLLDRARLARARRKNNSTNI
jgi:hypothetical protein